MKTEKWCPQSGDMIEALSRWKKPRMVSVACDLFGEEFSPEFIDGVFVVMDLYRQYTFQVLTKYPERMAGYLKGNISLSLWPLPNVWIGTPCQNQDEADERIPHLKQVPAAVRFLACEPLLGPVDLGKWIPLGERLPAAPVGFESMTVEKQNGLIEATARAVFMTQCEIPFHWVIAGGESGPGARPMHPDWPRSLRDQCQAAGVPFHFKGWGEWHPSAREWGIIGGIMPKNEPRSLWLDINGRTAPVSSLGISGQCYAMWRGGKKLTGRLLDGRTHDEMPEAMK